MIDRIQIRDIHGIWAVFFFVLLLVACLPSAEKEVASALSTATGTVPPVTETKVAVTATTANSQVSDFKPEQAEARLREHIAEIPPLKDAMVTRTPDLDVAGLYAFSVIPSATGLAGEVYYLLGPDEMLTSGWPSDFDKIMKRLAVGQNPDLFDVHTFARLFLPLRALRRGVVLEQPNGHILLRLRPELLPSGQFSPPQVDFDASGTRYRFWTFDADRMESVFWDVQVAPDGTTSFASHFPDQ